MATLNDKCREVAVALLNDGETSYEARFSVSNSTEEIVVIVRQGDTIQKAPLRKGLTEQVRILMGPSQSGVCECCGK